MAILIPLMRPQNLKSVVDSIVESTSDYRIIVIAATGECADATATLPVTLLEDQGGTWPQRINAGYKTTTEQYVMTAADDLAFRPGWFEAAMRVMEPLDGVVAVNDLHNTAGVHFFLARSYIENFRCVLDEEPGIIACESYRHAYVDDEIRSTALFHGKWGGVVQDAVVEHLHVGRGKAPMDEVYEMGSASMSQGYTLFMSRAHLWANKENS